MRTMLPCKKTPRRWDSRPWLMLTLAGWLANWSVSAQDTLIAYEVSTNAVGTQSYGGALGMDFDVQNPIDVKQLGVFDDGSDGLTLPLTAYIYDRDQQTALATVQFTPEDPGVLIGGSRFKPLDSPLRLDLGFHGSVVAEGYGDTEKLLNSGGDTNNIKWVLHDGNGSIQFVGGSRYGDSVGAFPASVDAGPADRYAAGTFQFQTTPPLAPGVPVVKVQPGDKQITLSWAPVTTPMAAATYRILRAGSTNGPFAQIAEITTTNYTDLGLTNGAVVCYVVRGVSSTGKVGPDSLFRFGAPYVLGTNQVVAYSAPAATAGTQAFSTPVGLDFDVYNKIVVTHLGVFDDNSDGLYLSLTATLYDRTNMIALASVAFYPDDAGVLVEGIRFKPLDTPIQLAAGFQGTIVGEGYGAEERLANAGALPAGVVTGNDGNGSLIFVGAGRYSLLPGVFPETLDAGAAVHYAAGTFEYQTTAAARPAVPTVVLELPTGDEEIDLHWLAITNPMPAVKYQILRSTNIDGAFAQVAEVTTLTYRDTGLTNGIQFYYRIRAIGSGGEASPDSNQVSGTPNPRAAGVAYINPAALAGTQAFGGALGMDFDVAKPIRITKLGVFDDNSDGLTLTLTAMIFNRETQTALATNVFTQEDPGDLVDGSRFKPLAQPLGLPAGFKGSIVASGYGAGEQLFNTGNLPENVALLKTFDGGSIVFTGASRWSNTPETFPTTIDQGPANRYAAGTFYFEPMATVVQPVLSISFAAGKLSVLWTGSGTLQSAPDLNGPWNDVAGASSGSTLSTAANRAFYRLKL